MPEKWLERERDISCRRQAIHIADQLPEDPEEALLVLFYVKKLVESFMSPIEVVRSDDGAVISFPAPPVRATGG